MPLTTPDLSTDAPAALSGLLAAAAGLGASALCCDWIGVTPAVWGIAARALSTARDGRGPFGHSASRVGPFCCSPALPRRRFAVRRSPVRTPAAPLPLLPGRCPLASAFAP